MATRYAVSKGKKTRPQSFSDSCVSHSNGSMRLVSEPRLKKLRASNKLKCDRLARKAQLARISRRKKAQKMDGLRAENASLKSEIERLRKENEELQAATDFHSAMRAVEGCVSAKPNWLHGILRLLAANSTQNELQLDNAQMAELQNMGNSEIRMLADAEQKCQMLTQEMKASNEERELLQRQIFEKLSKVLTPQQLSQVSKLTV